ncbi:MAG: maleylpyruvate isomerase family mycothiol-dependent enzyme, partial [Actinobacteria bacterium]|nr:maleylpyruvate isomerase family mycothiol-dependent enzyme [Actinomycetota bacterium]
MTTTAVRVSDIPPLDHDEAMALAEVEYDRLIEAVESLTPAQWAAPTDCAGWDVRAVVGHLLGMMELDAHPAELARQLKAATQRMQSTGEDRIDALTAIQVEEHASLTVDELLAALRAMARRALAARAALTADERARPYDPGPPFDGPWTRGYLLDIIHTRDPFMHRVDIARATAAPVALSAEQDGRIVADVVADWARRHA